MATNPEIKYFAIVRY